MTNIRHKEVVFKEIQDKSKTREMNKDKYSYKSEIIGGGIILAPSSLNTLG